MLTHPVKVSPSKTPLPKTEQLAWKLASLATDPAPILPEVAEMACNRIIDNAAVAIAAVNRPPVASARTQALAHPRNGGATVFGVDNKHRFHCEWAAWANSVAVRELDMHDTFLAADYSHPADNIPPLIAVAQQCGCSGIQLLRGITIAYEVQIDLTRSICLHEHKIDHIAHLAPSVAAGIGAMLGLDTDTIYQAIQQAVHVSFTTRQSRKGEISTWKAHAPAHAAKLAIESIDRAMRGEKSPSPIYEGEESIIAVFLGGRDACYQVPLPAIGEPCRAILDSYTKEHSAEYQAQAWIDLALRLHGTIALDSIRKITLHTSHHTHAVIGNGSNDPQKYDPHASRETLDHSLMFIFATALYTGYWHHVKSYASEVTENSEIIALWQKIKTVEDAEWTRRYHSNRLDEKAFGGRMEILFADGSKREEEIAVADAHPLGKRPFARVNYITKFDQLTDGLISPEKTACFLATAQRIGKLNPDELGNLNVALSPERLACAKSGIFDVIPLGRIVTL